MTTQVKTQSGSAIEMKPKRKSSKKQSVADRVDKHVCYELSVQDPEPELEFIENTFEELKGRKLKHLREDFCGTGNTSCAWVAKGRGRTAIGLDIDQPTLDWGVANNLSKLSEKHQERVKLVNCDVLEPTDDACGADAVVAHNFSYWLFKDRKTLCAYFAKVRETLADDGVLFLDCYGGWESHDVLEEPKDVEVPKSMVALFGGDTFEYIWDQDEIDPVRNNMKCYIHFKFLDGSEMRKAFSYDWRMWSIPEIRELLAEAGFKKSTVYWEGVEECACGKDDCDCECEGDGIFEPVEEAETCQSWICYLTAEK
ncbi:MAG: class I SAM-dependent methyltransferase [Phycisphaeraceae bacterium]|nr:class I SAM-dependent methyltransferase [Phycisphaerales bacterium]MCB9861132.1 class I SAM-dependent methyltransferase [Phycisphaeraceae bacterium]